MPTPDQWLPGGGWEPVRVAKRLPSLSQSEVPNGKPEHPTLTKWWQPLSEPVRTGPDKRVRWLGENDLQLVPAQQHERITLDKWFQPLAQPVRTGPAKTITWLGESKVLTPQVTLAQWWQPLSEPVRVRPGQQHISRWLGESDLQLTAAQQPERHSPDRWWQPLSVPRFEKPRNQYLYRFFSAPDELPPVSALTQPQMQVIT